MEKDRDFWTAAELAEACGVGSSRIRQLLLSGQIAGIKVAGVWLIDNDEARRWLEQKKYPRKRGDD